MSTGTHCNTVSRLDGIYNTVKNYPDGAKPLKRNHSSSSSPRTFPIHPFPHMVLKMALILISLVGTAAQIAPCTFINGSLGNANNCTCGANTCSPSNGLFCKASHHTCSNFKSSCNNTNGTIVNQHSCYCGTEDCKQNEFCSSVLNVLPVVATVATSTCYDDDTVIKDLVDGYLATDEAISFSESEPSGEHPINGMTTCQELQPYCSLVVDAEFESELPGLSSFMYGFTTSCPLTCGVCMTMVETIVHQCKKLATCTVQDGSAANAFNCSCGPSDCSSTTGLYCQASLGRCSKLATCTFVDGSIENANNCSCGFNTCTPSNGLFCQASHHTCTHFQSPFTMMAGSNGCEIVDNYNCVQTINYPNDYATDRKCTIKVNKFGKLQVKDPFDVEYEASCAYDYLTVHEEKYCGTSAPPYGKYIESNNIMEWKSDSVVAERGFKICYEPPLDHCNITNGTLTNDNPCLCGRNDCKLSVGMYCQASINKCSKVAVCTNFDGSIENPISCTCGE
jgi:hypothetical protein